MNMTPMNGTVTRNSTPASQRESARQRRWRGMTWGASLLFALLCTLALTGLNGLTGQAQAAELQSTVPPRERTELLGPIDEMTSSSEWIVAGISVHLSPTTRIDERVAPAAPGVWVKVEGRGDGSGGLNAHRIKVLPDRPHMKVEGALTALSPTSAQVDGISVALSGTAQIVGDPQPGVDRVEVYADQQPDNSWLGFRVQKEGPAGTRPDDTNEDRPDPQDRVQLYGIISSRPNPDAVGRWIVSGVPVSVTAQTILVERVGPLAAGAWVQVQGSVDENGLLVARRIRTISQRTHHRVKGVLQELTETSLRVGGIGLLRDANTQIEGNPTVDQRVEVDADLPEGGSLLAVKIEADDDEHERPDRNTVEFVGPVETLPDGTLYGEWQVAGRRVIVTEGVTRIDEHKGAVAVDVLVKVEGTRNEDGSINALEIDVRRGEGDENRPGGDQNFTRFVGAIEALPADGLQGEWRVEGKRVIVDERTELEGASFAISDTVKVKGYVQDDGAVVARKIEPKNGDGPGDGPGDDQRVRFTGPIQNLPPDGLLGEWRVDGKRVLVNPQTELKDNSYQVGDVVEIEGQRRPDSVIVAKKIEKED